MVTKKIDGKQEFLKMKEEIAKVGGMLYQYRPCRRNESTIYDIENIRHNVAFSQTPLNMNDPFDSQIGFSADSIYDEIISMVLDILPGEESTKRLMGVLLKYRLFGKMTELISALNELKKSILLQRKAMHKENMSLDSFCACYFNNIYNKMPKMVKANYSKEMVKLFFVLVSLIKDSVISEETLSILIGADKKIEGMLALINDLRDNVYLPTFEKFLSNLKVSCFSASGWNNTLMWSHYANSFSGFCVEYDFTNNNKFIGFVKEVKYSKSRPNVSLKDLGIAGLKIIETSEGTKNTEIVYGEFDINKILGYLITKNECWKYEDEWRIINRTEDTAPYFIEMPKINSVTFGINMDPLCRQLLWDVCSEKEIQCFELVLGKDNFSIDRRQLSAEDFVSDFGSEIDYINLIAGTFAKNSEVITLSVEKIGALTENGILDDKLYVDTLKYIIDAVTDIYFLKFSVNRIFKNDLEKDDDFDVKGVKEAILQIDDFLSSVKKLIEACNELFPKILLGGKISLSQYLHLNNQKIKMESLVDKVLDLKWPDSILK